MPARPWLADKACITSSNMATASSCRRAGDKAFARRCLANTISLIGTITQTSRCKGRPPLAIEKSSQIAQDVLSGSKPRDFLSGQWFPGAAIARVLDLELTVGLLPGLGLF